MSLSNIVAVITGANRGIGLEWVKQLSSKPDNVVIATTRSFKSATELQNLAKERTNVVVLELEASDPASIQALVKEIKSRKYSHINLLVNNAGIFGTDNQKVDSLTKEQFAEVLHTNTIGPFLVTQAFLPLLRQTSGDKKQLSVVVNTSSVLGQHAFVSSVGWNATAYTTSKAALNMVTTEFANQIKDVQFIALHPGYVKTDMAKGGGDITTFESVSSMIHSVEKEIASNRSGTFLNYDGKVLPY